MATTVARPSGVNLGPRGFGGVGKLVPQRYPFGNHSVCGPKGYLEMGDRRTFFSIIALTGIFQRLRLQKLYGIAPLESIWPIDIGALA